MKRTAWVLITVCALSIALAAQTRIYQKGTVIRMRMTQCMATNGGIMAALSGQPASIPSAESCPEYTLVSEKVVYVIVAKSSRELIPLAEDIDFRLQKNELLIHVDDTTREVRLTVRSMTLRPEWELTNSTGAQTQTTRVAHSGSSR